MLLALVTDAPHPSKGQTDRYLQKVIEAVADYAGIEVDTEIVPAVPVQQPGGKVPPAALIRSYRQDLAQRIEALKPDAVMTLGAAAMNGFNTTSKALSLQKEHGRMRWLPGVSFYLPWTPAIAPIQAVRNPDLHRDLVNVTYKVLTQRAPIPEADIEVIVPDDLDALSDSVALLDDSTVIGVDVETWGLSAYRDGLLAVGLGAISTPEPDGSAYGLAVVVRQELLQDPGVNDILWDAVWRRSRRSVGHNFKFDQQFLARHVGWAPEEARLGDTLLLAHLLDERPNRPTSRARGSGLKDLVAQRYDYQYGFDFKDFYALLDDPNTPEEQIVKVYDEMHEYLGHDVVYTARLWHDLEKEANEESPKLVALHDSLLMPASRTIARCEYSGAPIDAEWVVETMNVLDRRIARRQKGLEATVGRLAFTQVVTNILSPTQVADLMYDEWGMTPDIRVHGRIDESHSTDKDHVEAAVAKYSKSPVELERRRAKWLASLLKLRKDVKTRTTYQQSILDKLDDDGRVRAGFLLHGTSTGRLSSQGPNLQNIPAVGRPGSDKRRPMRRAFAPGPGRLWVEVDYSQLELRVAAGISGDKAFGDVFRNKRDIHLEVASSIFSKPPEQIEKAERFMAKAVSFGIIYGRTAKALAGGAEMEYAKRELGMKPWTEDVAQAFINKFLRSYPELDAWMTRMHKECPVQGYVESPFGRRRRFPLTPSSRSELGSIQRQAVNTPVQSAASDICLTSMVEIVRQVDAEGLDAVVMFPVHDSICIEVAESDIQRLEVICRRVMERDFMGVPLTVDFESGPNWADVH